MASIADNCLELKTITKKTQISHSFDALVLVTSIPLETSIPLKYSIYNIQIII